MAKFTAEELLDGFKEMTLLELSEFVKLFETTFDVKAAAPVAADGCHALGQAVRHHGGVPGVCVDPRQSPGDALGDVQSTVRADGATGSPVEAGREQLRFLGLVRVRRRGCGGGRDECE